MHQKRELLSQLERVNGDLIRRSVSGIIVYTVVWPLLAYITNFYQQHPEITQNIIIALLSVGVARTVFNLKSQSLKLNKPTLWRLLFSLGAVAHATIWSMVFCLSLFDQRFESISSVISIATAGLAAGSTMTLSPSRKLNFFYTSTLLVPGGTVCIYSQQYDMAVIVFMFTIYLYFQGMVFRKEYYYAIDIEQKMLKQQEELERLNKTDGLTNIFNRRHFDESIKYLWSDAARNGSTLSLLFIDLDHFKSINDTHGHLAGDDCLRETAKVIEREASRYTDIVTRYGGEEFAVLLPNTESEGAYYIAEKIRKKIASHQGDNIDIQLTASIGVASIKPDKTEDYSPLVEQADQALYKAKLAGRNFTFQDFQGNKKTEPSI